MRDDRTPEPGAIDAGRPAEDWRSALVEDLMAVLGQVPGVRQVRVHGSAAGPPEHLDYWSDLDVDLHADAPAAAELYRDMSWLAELGPVWAVQRQADPDRATVRVVFSDSRRLDATIVHPGAGLAPRGRPVGSAQPALFREGRPDSDEAVWTGFPVVPGDADPVRVLANEFRFDAVLAVAKAARQDPLIAAHLTFGLAQKVLVVRMLLRDREAGTSHHRRGHADACRSEPGPSLALNPSIRDLLSAIGDLAVAFDQAAVAWGPVPAIAEEPLMALLEAAAETR